MLADCRFPGARDPRHSPPPVAGWAEQGGVEAEPRRDRSRPRRRARDRHRGRGGGAEAGSRRRALAQDNRNTGHLGPDSGAGEGRCGGTWGHDVLALHNDVRAEALLAVMRST